MTVWPALRNSDQARSSKCVFGKNAYIPATPRYYVCQLAILLEHTTAFGQPWGVYQDGLTSDRVHISVLGIIMREIREVMVNTHLSSTPPKNLAPIPAHITKASGIGVPQAPVRTWSICWICARRTCPPRLRKRARRSGKYAAVSIVTVLKVTPHVAGATSSSSVSGRN